MSAAIDGFMARVRKDSACWEWTGALNSSGYGWLRFEGSNRAASRVSWILHRGQIESGLHVLHSCDNRRCVNPEHLRLGTNAENVRDCVSRGRQVHQRGERHGRAKLTADGVRRMRIEHAAGASLRTLAAQYGVALATARDACSGANWRDI